MEARKDMGNHLSPSHDPFWGHFWGPGGGGGGASGYHHIYNMTKRNCHMKENGKDH